MTDWVVEIINTLGYFGLAALMLVECVFPPIPSEAILPFAGFSVAQGDMNYYAAVGAATAGSVIGNLILYVAGRWGGVPLVDRYGSRVGATPERVEMFTRWMARWGVVVLLVARAIPLARTAISVPAGVARYPVGMFLLLTLIGSLIWNGVLIGIGWALNDAWRDVEETMGPASYIVVGLMLVAGAIALLVVRRRSRARAAGAE